MCPPGAQTGGKGGEAWNLWEGRLLTHPCTPGQYPAAHRTPECSCRTAAWTWHGWTLRSRSKTCGDNDKSAQHGTALDRPAHDCPSKSTRSGQLPLRPCHLWLHTLLTIDSGLPPLHWLGRRRPPLRAHWDPAAASSPPPPAPSCQLQPQRGPSPGLAEDPKGPRPDRAARTQRRRSFVIQRVPTSRRCPRASVSRVIAAARDVAGSGRQPDSLTREVEPRAPLDRGRAGDPCRAGPDAASPSFGTNSSWTTLFTSDLIESCLTLNK